MKSTILSLCLLALAIVLCIRAEENKILGNFSTKLDSSCRYTVMDFKDDNKTGVHIKCSCSGGRGAGSKKIQYSCVYFGSPRECNAYLDTLDGPEVFFSEFANFIQGIVSNNYH